MSKPITVLERKPVETELVEREYTYEELLELFPDGGESIVNPLVRRCQEYEAAIEQLQKDRSRSENELDRLREWVAAVEDGYDKQKAEIERLRTENKRLRAKVWLRHTARNPSWVPRTT